MKTLFKLQEEKCCNISIIDQTDYNPKTRDDYGIAIFISEWDAQSNQFIINHSLVNLNNSSAWYFDLPNNLTNYKIDIYLIPKFTSMVNVNTNDINYVTGSGFMQFNGNAQVNPPDPSGWDILTITDYTIFDQYYTQNGYKYTLFYEKCKCPDIQIKQLHCHSWEICNCTDEAIFVSIKDINNNDVEFETNDTVIQGNQLTINPKQCSIFDIKEDGVYYLYIQEKYIPAPIHLIPFIDFCSIQACYINLIKEILCNETDPCCKTCSKEELELLKNKRYELNKILGLYFMLIQMTKSIDISFIGQTSFPSQILPNEVIKEIKLMDEVIKKIKFLIGRCGKCEDGLDMPILINPCGGC